MKLNIEIWRHADDPHLIHLKHNRFHAQVTDREGLRGYYPSLYKKLSELLQEGGEAILGERQHGEGRRTARRSEPEP